MPSKFRLESFEPVEIEKAQKALDQHLKEALEFQKSVEANKNKSKKKGFFAKLVGWFK